VVTSLRTEKLHVKFAGDVELERVTHPRRYTLTHSDRTGDLFLTIGAEYDQQSISGWYTRLMRDEVMAEYRVEEGNPELHVYCHVSGGIIIGTAGWRYRIFRYHMPMVLQAFCYGDQCFLRANPEYQLAAIFVHFKSTRSRYNKVEHWGRVEEYKVSEGDEES
jgi:hypothetical protein